MKKMIFFGMLEKAKFITFFIIDYLKYLKKDDMLVLFGE
jgi:hypothetical protein